MDVSTILEYKSRTYLVISTPGKHGDHLLLAAILPCELAPLQAFLFLFSKMAQSLEESTRSREKFLCFTDLSVREAALDDILGFGHESGARFEVIHEADMAIAIGAEDIW